MTVDLEVTDEHDNIYTYSDRKAGLRAIVALHRPRGGVAMGATRLLPYASEADAQADALRLSRAMTAKAACAGLPVGGGKAVIIADPRQKTDELLRSYGRFVESLGGRFITGQDMNLSERDVAVIAEETDHVTGIAPGAPGPALMTARGVFAGVVAALQFRFGTSSLASVHVVVQGAGAVGATLAGLLRDAGARVSLVDLDPARAAAEAERLGVEARAADAPLDSSVDVFAPCGAGGVLNPRTIPLLGAAIVAGAANNQLAHPERDGAMLAHRGIVYCPDFVLNAGGLIEVFHQHFGYDTHRVVAAVDAIGTTLAAVLEEARADDVSPHVAALRAAERHLAEPLSAPLVPQRRARADTSARSV